MKRSISETEKLNNKENMTMNKDLKWGKKYCTLFDKMLNGFALCKLLTDKRGNPIDYIFLEVNKAFEKINSIKKEEVINKKVTEVFGFKDIPDLEKYFQVALQGKKRVFETYIPRYNKYFKVSSYSPKKGYFVNIFEDITQHKKDSKKIQELNKRLNLLLKQRTKELKEAQDQLIQSEKLSIIGQLVAGVAHEIRNPLTTMSLAIEHLEKKCYGDFQKNKLKVVQKNIIRINKIIQGLLTFSRPYSFNFTCENVNVIVERLEPILEELHPRNIKDIKIIKKYNPKLPEVWVDSDHLEQVFLNLALNAIEAMGYNGELYISTSYDPKQKKIKIKFKDTGCGIAEENLKKIFHPFFTTRKDGTGLGLSICQMIINEHKGNISAESRLGKGTTFTILLPLNRRRGRQINDQG